MDYAVDDANPPKDACSVRKGPFWTCVSIVVYTVAGVIFAFGALQILGPLVSALSRD